MKPAHPASSNDIAEAFDRGAEAYDYHARIQQHCARLLETRIASFLGDSPILRVVDLGCGTGTFTRALAQRYPHAAFVACDIATAMVEKTQASLNAIALPDEQRRFSVLQADAETATFSPSPDLVASNLAMQWFADPLGALAHHARRSHFLAWTTLIQGTFASWIAAHESRGFSHGLRSLLDAASIVATAERLNPLRLSCTIDQVDEHFPNAIAFLRDLRSMGANTARPDHAPTPLHQIIRSFEAGFTAEYRICTILLEMRRPR